MAPKTLCHGGSAGDAGAEVANRRAGLVVTQTGSLGGGAELLFDFP